MRTAVLDIAGFEEPVIGQLVSVPMRTTRAVSTASRCAAGGCRAPKPGEAVLAEPFAKAHGLEPGDRLRAI